MAIFISKSTFSDEYARITSVFNTAFESARKLSEKMTAEIAIKNQQIEQITSEINEVKAIAEKNDEFIRKISDFIK